MHHVYETIVKARNDSGKLAKIAILEAMASNDDVKSFLDAAYEQRVNFYMKKVEPKFATNKLGGTIKFTRELFDQIVDQLSTRQVTGKAAKSWIANLYNGFEHEWEKELLTLLIGRDVKAGFNVSTINTVWPGLLTDIPYMRCCLPKETNLKAFPWARGVYSQIKADGTFTNITHHEDGTVTMMTRAGSPYPLDFFTDLVAEIKAKIPRGFQVHGELLMMKDGKVLPRQVGNGQFNSIQQEGEVEDPDMIAVYDAWDMIPYSEAKVKNKYHVAYENRFKALEGYIGEYNESSILRVIEYKIVYSLKEAFDHYLECLENGLEGTVVKNPDAIWEDTTSKNQVKLKLEFEVDLRIKGFNPGNGKNAKTFGSIRCESEDGKLVVNVSGFPDPLRKKIWEDRDHVLEKIMCVRANGIMEPSRKKITYSMFLPRHIEIRSDKREGDTIERIQAQFDAAIKAVADMA